MHIMEGFLPANHALGWSIASAPFVLYGFRELARAMRRGTEHKLMLSSTGGFSFVLSSLKIPSVTGSCSHPTGIALGVLIFGPGLGFAVGFFVLLFQALLLAHGGLTTLGANVFSMAVAGSLVAFAVHRGALRIGLPIKVAVFLAASLSDLMTYVITSAQLAFAFPDPTGGFTASLVKFIGVFALTQVPIAISEGLLTVLAMNLFAQYMPRDRALPWLAEDVKGGVS